LSSDSVEEYLEAVYGLNEQGKKAKNQELAKKLKISPPSVTQMIKKMAEEGLVEYEPYKGATLTGKGNTLAQKVVRKHRLLERFLYDYLKLPIEKIHDEACRMEHSLSDETTAALCKALDNPQTCPDNLPIPQCSLEVEDCEQCEEARSNIDEKSQLTTQLSKLHLGEEGVVAYIRSGRHSGKRLQDMGLTPGTHIKIVNAAPFKGPIEIEVRGTSLALGRSLASHIYIHVEDERKQWKGVHPHGPHHKRAEAR
jgi:DtxR family Mn-dependent transcriptional regulator